MDDKRSLMERQAAAAYIASFVGRATFIRHASGTLTSIK
jgi:hypothetical protein